MSTKSRYTCTVCYIQNLYFQGFETPKEYIASQGKFYMNKDISILIRCIMNYVINRYPLLDLKVLRIYCFFKETTYLLVYFVLPVYLYEWYWLTDVEWAHVQRDAFPWVS